MDDSADPGQAEPVLQADDLVKTFTAGSRLSGRRVSAVDGVSLELTAGRTLGVVGESGCGKSTLARLLVGLERPDSGAIRYHGRDVSRGRRADRRALRDGVQMIFQDPYTSLDPRMTVEQLVGEPIAARHTLGRSGRRDRVVELLELVGLSSQMLPRFPHQFSGGQRQRLGIARALAPEPSVVVCDEPVSALDVSVQAQVVNLLGDLQQRLGVAFVFIAHDLAVVRHVADEVAVMYLGRVVEHGRTEDVFRAPAHPYTSSLLSASPSVEPGARGTLARRRILGGEPPSPLDPPPGCRFNPRCWMATEECRTEVPLLVHRAGTAPEGRLSACHHAERLQREIPVLSG